MSNKPPIYKNLSIINRPFTNNCLPPSIYFYLWVLWRIFHCHCCNLQLHPIVKTSDTTPPPALTPTPASVLQFLFHWKIQHNHIITLPNISSPFTRMPLAFDQTPDASNLCRISTLRRLHPPQLVPSILNPLIYLLWGELDGSKNRAAATFVDDIKSL